MPLVMKSATARAVGHLPRVAPRSGRLVLQR